MAPVVAPTEVSPLDLNKARYGPPAHPNKPNTWSFQKAFYDYYPNGIPVNYKMASVEPNVVPTTYTDDYVDIGFYVNPNVEVKAIFSTNHGEIMPRTLSRVTPVRTLHLWNAESIQKYCNSIRKKYWRDMKSMVKPEAWLDLYNYFDSHDIFLHGPLNLWNVVVHLYAENQIIIKNYHANIAYEVGIWADDWLQDTDNRNKLAAWDVQSDVLNVLSRAELEDVNDLDNFDLNLLRAGLAHRHAQLFSKTWAAPPRYPHNNVMTAYKTSTIHNWLAGQKTYSTTSGLPSMISDITDALGLVPRSSIPKERVGESSAEKNPPSSALAKDTEIASAERPPAPVIVNGARYRETRKGKEIAVEKEETATAVAVANKSYIQRPSVATMYRASGLAGVDESEQVARSSTPLAPPTMPSAQAPARGKPCLSNSMETRQPLGYIQQQLIHTVPFGTGTDGTAKPHEVAQAPLPPFLQMGIGSMNPAPQQTLADVQPTSGVKYHTPIPANQLPQSTNRIMSVVHHGNVSTTGGGASSGPGGPPAACQNAQRISSAPVSREQANTGERSLELPHRLNAQKPTNSPQIVSYEFTSTKGSDIASKGWQRASNIDGSIHGPVWRRTPPKNRSGVGSNTSSNNCPNRYGNDSALYEHCTCVDCSRRARSVILFLNPPPIAPMHEIQNQLGTIMSQWSPVDYVSPGKMTPNKKPTMSVVVTFKSDECVLEVARLPSLTCHELQCNISTAILYRSKHAPEFFKGSNQSFEQPRQLLNAVTGPRQPSSQIGSRYAPGSEMEKLAQLPPYQQLCASAGFPLPPTDAQRQVSSGALTLGEFMQPPSFPTRQPGMVLQQASYPQIHPPLELSKTEPINPVVSKEPHTPEKQTDIFNEEWQSKPPSEEELLNLEGGKAPKGSPSIGRASNQGNKIKVCLPDTPPKAIKANASITKECRAPYLKVAVPSHEAIIARSRSNSPTNAGTTCVEVSENKVSQLESSFSDSTEDPKTDQTVESNVKLEKHSGLLGNMSAHNTTTNSTEKKGKRKKSKCFKKPTKVPAANVTTPTAKIAAPEVESDDTATTQTDPDSLISRPESPIKRKREELFVPRSPPIEVKRNKVDDLSELESQEVEDIELRSDRLRKWQAEESEESLNTGLKPYRADAGGSLRRPKGRKAQPPRLNIIAARNSSQSYDPASGSATLIEPPSGEFNFPRSTTSTVVSFHTAKERLSSAENENSSSERILQSPDMPTTTWKDKDQDGDGGIPSIFKHTLNPTAKEFVSPSGATKTLNSTTTLVQATSLPSRSRGYSKTSHTVTQSSTSPASDKGRFRKKKTPKREGVGMSAETAQENESVPVTVALPIHPHPQTAKTSQASVSAGKGKKQQYQHYRQRSTNFKNSKHTHQNNKHGHKGHRASLEKKLVTSPNNIPLSNSEWPELPTATCDRAQSASYPSGAWGSKKSRTTSQVGTSTGSPTTAAKNDGVEKLVSKTCGETSAEPKEDNNNMKDGAGSGSGQTESPKNGNGKQRDIVEEAQNPLPKL